ncbi:MAG: hydantoinase B/oxoprolinase family protein [Myxococcota bacterium]
MSAGARTFVDRGGTFTDVVTVDDAGRLDVRKVPSDRAVVGRLARGALTFGTTVATNALLERKGVRTLLVVSRGFADLPWIGDQARPDLFDLEARWPAPLCDLVIEVGGRVDAGGRALEPLDVPDELTDLVRREGVEAAAIVLLNSHRNPAHEEAVAEALGDVPFVTLGHRVSPEVGYLGRIETTLVDAAITPVLRRALDRDEIPDDALAMRSDGSLCPAPALRAPDAVLSGPSGGVLAVAAVARQAGFDHAVGLDMGGTSTDVCRVDVGRLPRDEGEVRVAGVRLRRPMFEVETIAAGGGSILAGDGLRLTVGPESAGADPGPQCYGRGGPPTLTDAALAQGLVDPGSFDPPLRPDLVSLPGAAGEFLDIAREAMAQAVRHLATSRGVDLRDHALVGYGGAAGQHAAQVARRLGIRTVLVHPAASVLCAWGQALAHREESSLRPIWRPLPDAWDETVAALDDLEAALPALGAVIRSVELRHRGTDHAIDVRLPEDAPRDLEPVLEAFARVHRRRYGFDRPGQVVEVVNARVRVRAPLEPLPTIDDDPWGLGDETIRGPELLTTPTTAIHVPEGWSARREHGLLRMEETRPKPPSMPAQRTPYAVELWGNRFQAVAEDAGEALRRLARSVNIRERRDFSCALFDGDGRLVANAPHIPVHLGAMGETVRDLLRRHPAPEPGQAWLSNDPFAGGSHLPDLTVVTPVEADGHRWFVACRGHHVDVGGLTPGSMPPHSSRLEEEGFVVRHLPLLEGGRLRDVRDALVGCREPDTVLADLEAQVAANAHAAALLAALGPADLVDTWMHHLHDVADEAVGEVLERLQPGRAEDAIGGIPLRMALEVRDGVLHVDLAGTGGPHAGNLNAPKAVVRAAVLYGLRVLVGRPIPLNEGALRRVRIHRPEPSIVAPPHEAAVAGGNVETSQRLVDLFLRAADARAASQGTMNNLTLGARGGGDRPAWSLYETIGGGLGASEAGPGADGTQVHMTNTRATDAEVLEERLPVRLRAFRHRAGSGGAGRHRGGDGLVREIELVAPGSAALLATRRDVGAPGMHGGQDGAPGRDAIRRGGSWEPWDGRSVDLEPGDRVRVETPGGGGWGSAGGEAE